MSEANTLLESLTTDELEKYAVSPVNDVLIINPETRTITIPSSEILLGVMTDQDVERKYFQCPRIVGDNIDLSSLSLRIPYINAGGYADFYIVEDLTVSGDYITFSWLLSEKVLKYQGKVSFAVCAVKALSDGTTKNVWNTTMATGTVLNGIPRMDINEDEEYEFRDVLNQLLSIIINQKDEAIVEIQNEGIAQMAALEKLLIHSNASGTTILTTDSAKAKPNIKVFGKSTQKTTEGYQLFDISKIKGFDEFDNEDSYEHRALSVENDSIFIRWSYDFSEEHAYVSDSTPLSVLAPSLEVGKKYCVSFVGTTYVYLGGTRYASGKSITITEKMLNSEVGWDIFYGVDDSATRISEIMFNEGTTPLPYEPYTNGIPTPSLTHREEVTPICESGSVVISLDAKNLYRGRYYIVEANPPEYLGKNPIWLSSTEEPTLPFWSGELDGVGKIVPCKAGQTYTMSANNINEYGTLGISEYADIESALSVDNVLGGIGPMERSTNYITYTAKTDGILLCGVFGTWLEGGGEHYCTEGEEIQVELGTVATEYEVPKDEQTLTLQTPNGLPGIPLGATIPDAIKSSPIHMSGVYWDEVEQQYYISDTKNENGKDVQRILECDNSYFVKTDFIRAGYRISYGKASSCPAYAGALCTHLLLDNTVWSQYSVEGDYMQTAEGTLKVRFTQSFDNLDACKNYLNENNIKFYMVLAEPIITDTSEEEQAQYNSIRMNCPNTTIVNDAGAYMEAEYVADTKSYIGNLEKKHDNDIQMLKTAIIALGGTV